MLVGSALDARSAGRTQASVAMAERIATAATIVVASYGVTPKMKRSQDSGAAEREQRASRESDDGDAGALTDHVLQQVAPFDAKSQPDRHLAQALADLERHQPVHANRRKQQRDRAATTRPREWRPPASRL
jgi:hypothetical protein